VTLVGSDLVVFPIFLQGILHSALHGEFWRLIDPQGKPPGVMGWWPSRAVTFLENHDTGSTQVCSSVFFSVGSLLLSERKS
jgi:alpha-amylase